MIPLLGDWNKFDDIDFNKLPEQFVLKCNHDCGSVVFCTDKKTFDFENAQNKIELSLKRNYCDSHPWREWQYRSIKPRIIAEQYLKNKNGNIPEDYKIHCFNGKPIYIRLVLNRFTENIREAFYDVNWDLQEFNVDYPKTGEQDPQPKNLDEILELSSALSKDIPFVRVDLYESNDKIFFGESETPGKAGGLSCEPLKAV